MVVNVRVPDEWRKGVNTDVRTDVEWRTGGVVQVYTPSGWRIVHIGTPVLVKGTVSTTSASMSWQGVTDVARTYEIHRNGVYYSSVTGSGTLTYTNSGSYSSDSLYTYKVRVKTSDSSGTVYGPFSESIRAYSGRAEVRDSGSISNIKAYPSKLDSWRSVDSWSSMSNKAAQGTYGTYGSYKGVIKYSSVNGVREALRAGLGGGTTGTLRQQNGTCTKAEIYADRVAGVGKNAAVKMQFFRTNNDPTGGEPTKQGTAFQKNSPTAGSAAYVSIGTVHGQRMGDGDESSYSKCILIQYNGTAEYSQYKNMTLKLTWAWDYTTASARPAVWV